VRVVSGELPRAAIPLLERPAEDLEHGSTRETVPDDLVQEVGIASLDLFDIIGEVFWQLQDYFDRAGVPHGRRFSSKVENFQVKTTARI